MKKISMRAAALTLALSALVCSMQQSLSAVGGALDGDIPCSSNMKRMKTTSSAILKKINNQFHILLGKILVEGVKMKNIFGLATVLI